MAVVLVIVGVAAVTFTFIRSAEDRITADMVWRADRFTIPSGWTLESETVRSERFLCMDTNPCPSLFRRWEAGQELTLQDLDTMTSGVGFDMNPEGKCQRQSNAIGPTTACSSSGADDKYSYLVNVTSPDANQPHEVTVIIRPL